MSKAVARGPWLSTVLNAASKAGIELPSLAIRAVGNLILESESGDRFATIKRRFVPISEAASRGVELTLWRGGRESPTPVVALHEPLKPSQEEAIFVAKILNGWLVNQWSDQTAISNTKERTTRAFAVEPTAEPEQGGEFWLSADHAFGIVVKQDHWSVCSRNLILSTWRSKDGSEGGARFPLESLDALCKWLAEHWTVIAYGSDLRPEPLRTQSAAASRAFENAQLVMGNHTTETEKLRQWWSRHAIRAASEELPNVFLERQADDLVVSWDALPTSARFFQIPAGNEVLPADLAIPILRQLVASRLEHLQLDESLRRFFECACSADNAYAVITDYHRSVTREWLDSHGLGANQLAEFSLAGVSRNPVIGLLRSSQGSSVSLEDIDSVVRLLAPSDPASYQELLQLARGMDPRIDTREPWESGYRLADLVRERLEKSSSEYFDIVSEVLSLGVHIRDLTMSDPGIKAVCVGSPAYHPIVIVNEACADATGASGRRITLAHELCHLLFDRVRMKSLARFEGERAESDRLIEMRANAFAVQLLVPMSTLTHADGVVFTEDELAQVSVEQQVSLAALSWHARNLRNRFAN